MNAKVRITYRDKDNNEILNPTDGEKAYSPETKKLYQWSADAGEWKLIDGDINLNAVLGKIINAGITITAVNTHRSSIEEYYLAMMGGNKNA
jgi:hypothetical protein